MAVATTQVTGQTTVIPGLMVFEITAVEDDRGSFQELFHYEKLSQAGMPGLFHPVQTSLSRNCQRGTVRGFHAEPWDKYIGLICGRVYAAYVDLRKGDGFGRVVTRELDKYTTVFLPQGVANSFMTLDDDTTYIYAVNQHWRPGDYDHYTNVNLGDPSLYVPWPIPLAEAIMSDRDRTHPWLGHIKPIELAE